MNKPKHAQKKYLAKFHAYKIRVLKISKLEKCLKEYDGSINKLVTDLLINYFNT